MFGSLSEKLQGVVAKLASLPFLSEDTIRDLLRDLRLALLEADVNLNVVRDLLASLKEKAKTITPEKSQQPSQAFLQMVHAHLIELFGPPVPLKIQKGSHNIILMAGLQGSGKTTTTGKLARMFKDYKPLIVAADVYRPAAIQQLSVIASQVGVDFFEMGQGDPVEIARLGVERAKQNGNHLTIIDTAGRLQIDETLMLELQKIHQTVNPHEVFLVLDSMTGQEAVRVAQAFDARLGVSGFVLTKIDGDARGGAALSIRQVTGKPIQFLGVSEKQDGLELFSADRMVSRILGMGDVIGLAEKASGVIDEAKAKKMQRKLTSGEFNILDFLEQMEMMKKMGPLQDLLKMIPGLNQAVNQNQMVQATKEMDKILAIVRSMTPYERMEPSCLNASRKKRIAKGSGTQVNQINQFLNQFEQMKQTMKQMKKMGFFKPANLMKGKSPFGF